MTCAGRENAHLPAVTKQVAERFQAGAEQEFRGAFGNQTRFLD